MEQALASAEARGWRVDVRHNGHVWGRLLCPNRNRLGCQVSVSSTPRNAGNEARRIRRFVEGCSCQEVTEDG